jgi:hypothetical protein
MKVQATTSEYYTKSNQINLETKIKLLNDVGIMKKRSPMSAIGNYFSRSEEIKDVDSFPIQIYINETNQ